MRWKYKATNNANLWRHIYLFRKVKRLGTGLLWKSARHCDNETLMIMMTTSRLTYLGSGKHTMVHWEELGHLCVYLVRKWPVMGAVESRDLHHMYHVFVQLTLSWSVPGRPWLARTRLMCMTCPTHSKRWVHKDLLRIKCNETGLLRIIRSVKWKKQSSFPLITVAVAPVCV